MSDILLSIDGDTRPLESKLNRISSKSINFNLKDGISQPLGRITGKISEFDKSLEASNARVLAFGASAGAVYALGRAFKEMVSSTIEVEKSLTDINVVLNASSQQLSKFGSDLFGVAKNTGQSFNEVTKAATEFARQGLGVEETLKRTTDALILTRLSGMSAAQSVETLTAAVNSFSRAGLTTTEVLNKLATVDQAFAVSSSDLANALSRVGSTAQDVGVGIDELIGIVTAAQQTTARGGAVIGNSLKTIFTRLQRTDTLKDLESLGIAVRDVAGNTLPAVQILKNLSNVFYQLGDAQKASVAETVGGVFQINILRAALGDLSKEFSIYDNALRTSSSATDQAIQKNQALNQTLSSKLNKTLANLTQSATKVGDITVAPTLKGGLDVFNKVLEGFNKPAQSQEVGSKIATGILEGIGSYLSGPGVAVISAVFLKIFTKLSSFSGDALKSLLGITSQTDLIAQAQQKVNAILAQNPTLVEAIINKETTLLQVENQILQVLKAQNAARSAASAITSAVVPRIIQGVGSKKTKAFGFVPNFSPEMQEIMGAKEGGYKPGSIRNMNIPGEGNVIYNSAESIVKFPGASSPAIMPPENSKAGKDYRKKFKNEAGFDPYAAFGFVPNFANVKIPKGLELEKAIEGYNKGVYSRSQLSREYGAEAINKKLGPSRVSAPPTNQDINLGYTNRLSMIYPSKTGPSPATGVFKDVENNRYRVSFTKSGFNAKTAIKPEDALLKDSLGKNVINFVNNYISQLSNGKFQKITSIDQLANSGAFGSIVGTIFETAVTYATQSFKPRAGGQSALIDFPSPNKNLKELFNNAPGDYEAKGNDGQDLINDVARKIYQAGFVDNKIQKRNTIKKTKSKGFIPNFSALQDAIEREKQAGVNPNKIRVGTDQSLISKNNPYGLGVYNTKDEPMGLKQGIENAKSNGYVPNYAQPQQESTDNFERFQGKLLAASIALQLAGGITNQFADKTSKTTQSINDLILSLSNAATAFSLGGIFGKKLAPFVGPGLALGMGALQVNSKNEERKNQPYVTQLDKLEEKLNLLRDSANNLDSVLSKSEPLLNNYAEQLKNVVPDQSEIQKLRSSFLSAIEPLPNELKSKLIEGLQNLPALDEQTPIKLMGLLNQAQSFNNQEQTMGSLDQDLVKARQKQFQTKESFNSITNSLLRKLPGQSQEFKPYNPFEDKNFSERTSRSLLGDSLANKDSNSQNKTLISLSDAISKAGENGNQFLKILEDFSSGSEQSKKSLQDLLIVINEGGPEAFNALRQNYISNLKVMMSQSQASLKSSLSVTPAKPKPDYKDIEKTMDINELLGTQTEDMPTRLFATSTMRKRAAGVDSRTSGMYALQELKEISSLNSASFEDIKQAAPETVNRSLQEVMKSQEERASSLEQQYGSNNISNKIRERNTPQAAEEYLKKSLPIEDVTQGMFPKELPKIIVDETSKQELINNFSAQIDRLQQTLKTPIKIDLTQLPNNEKINNESNTGEKNNNSIDLIKDIVVTSLPSIILLLAQIFLNRKGGIGVGDPTNQKVKDIVKKTEEQISKVKTPQPRDPSTGRFIKSPSVEKEVVKSTGKLGFGDMLMRSVKAISLTTIAEQLANPTEFGYGQGGIGEDIERGYRNEPGGELTELGRRMGLPEKYGDKAPDEQTSKLATSISNSDKSTQDLKNQNQNLDNSVKGLDNSVKNLDNSVKNLNNKTGTGFVPSRNTSENSFLSPSSYTAPNYSNEDYERIFSSAAQQRSSNINNSSFDVSNFESSMPQRSSKFEQLKSAYANSEKNYSSMGGDSTIDSSRFSIPKGTMEGMTEEQQHNAQLMALEAVMNENSSAPGYNPYTDYGAAIAPYKRQYDELQGGTPAKVVNGTYIPGKKGMYERTREKQREKGFKTKDQRTEEQRRTGVIDSGFEKGYVEYGPDGKLTPEAQVTSRNYNSETGMIMSQTNQGQIGMESSVLQDEKKIFKDQVSQKYDPKTAQTMLQSLMNQKGKDENGRTGFQNLQAYNRVNSPNIPAPTLEGPEFLKDNIPMYGQNLQADLLFGAQQSVDQSKSLESLDFASAKSFDKTKEYDLGSRKLETNLPFTQYNNPQEYMPPKDFFSSSTESMTSSAIQPKTSIESAISKANASNLQQQPIAEQINKQTSSGLSAPSLSSVQEQAQKLREGTKNIAKPGQGYLPEKARMAEGKNIPGAVPTTVNEILKQTGDNPQRINDAVNSLSQELIKNSPSSPGGGTVESQEFRERIKMVQDQLMVKQGGIKEQQSKMAGYQQEQKDSQQFSLTGEIAGAKSSLDQRGWMVNQLPGGGTVSVPSPSLNMGQTLGSSLGSMGGMNQTFGSSLGSMGGMNQTLGSSLGSMGGNLNPLQSLFGGANLQNQEVNRTAGSEQQMNQNPAPAVENQQNLVSDFLDGLKSSISEVKQIPQDTQQQQEKPNFQEQPKEKDQSKEDSSKSFENVIKQADSFGSALEGLGEKIKSLTESMKDGKENNKDKNESQEKNGSSNETKELKISDVNANVNIQSSADTETQAKVAAINAIVKELQNQLNTLKQQVSGKVNPPQKM